MQLGQSRHSQLNSVHQLLAYILLLTLLLLHTVRCRNLEQYKAVSADTTKICAQLLLEWINKALSSFQTTAQQDVTLLSCLSNDNSADMQRAGAPTTGAAANATANISLQHVSAKSPGRISQCLQQLNAGSKKDSNHDHNNKDETVMTYIESIQSATNQQQGDQTGLKTSGCTPQQFNTASKANLNHHPPLGNQGEFTKHHTIEQLSSSQARLAAAAQYRLEQKLSLAAAQALLQHVLANTT